MVAVEVAAHRATASPAAPAAPRRARRSSTVTIRCRAASAASAGATSLASGSGRPAGTTRSAAASATRPYAVRLWCETPRCRSAGVGVGDPQRPDRPAAERRGGVDRLAGRGAGEAPGGAGTQVARALRDDATSAPQHVPGGEQPAVHVGGLQVAAERLPDRDRAGQRARAGRPACGRTRPAARRRRSSRTRSAAPGRSACTPARIAGSAECRSATTTGMPPRSVGGGHRGPVRRGLLVDAEHDRLQRRVPGLDHVTAGAGRHRPGPAAAGRGARRPARTRRCRGPAPAPRC